MGSRKRENLYGTGSQTNAYTDFHHTVFYASCPVALPSLPSDRTTMLDRALEALAEVLQPRFEVRDPPLWSVLRCSESLMRPSPSPAPSPVVFS